MAKPSSRRRDHVRGDAGLHFRDDAYQPGLPRRVDSGGRFQPAPASLDPNCAVCHDRIDPVGFALEKFDPLARFRHNYEDGVPVDASGTLYGTDFDGAARFKQVILEQKERFVRGFVEHVTRYALGRELRPADGPELERMTQRVLNDDCRFGAVIREVVLSEMFRAAPPVSPTPDP
jgi:hypothetical protein